MLLFFIVKFFILMEIQGSIIRDSCRDIGHNCSINDDCCTKTCLYVSEKAKAMCVLEIENLFDLSKSLPIFYDIASFDIRCNKDRDCVYPEKCMFRSAKTGGICRRVNYPVIPTTPKSCVLPGLHCKKDDDCCSKNCHRYFKTHITYCLSDDPPLCKLTGVECSRNIDCCSNHCDNYTTATSVRTCLPKTNGLSITAPLSLDISLFCLKAGSACISNEDCCSGLCSFSRIQNSKFHFCSNYL